VLQTADDESLRSEAARALGLVGSPGAAHALAAAATSASHEVARRAAHALVAVDADPLSTVEDTAPSPFVLEAMAFAGLADGARRPARRHTASAVASGAAA
jgi:HEAT repeat protein